MCSWEQIFVKHERPCVILLQKIIMEVPIIAAAYSSSSKKKTSRPYHTPLDIPMETSLTTRSPIFPTTDISA